MLNALLAAVATAVASAAIEYTNPVWPYDAPDPTVWSDGAGGWLSASTTHRILKSPDLVHWQDTGKKLLTEDESKWIAQTWPHVWAPDVIKIGDWYNLYLTFHNGGEHTAICAYRSKTPDGPFSDRRILVRSEGDGKFEVIDPEVVVDPKDGRVWLFFGHGDIRRVELTVDGFSRKPGSVIERVAGVPWQRIAGPYEWRPIDSSEGVYLYRRGDWWYLFVSEGAYFDHRYYIACGRARKLTDDFVDREGRPMKEAHSTTILSSGEKDEFYGPGHNGEIVTSPSGRTYMFYHCHWRNCPEKNQNPKNPPRPLFFQEVLWDKDGWPYFENGGRPTKKCVFK